MIMKSVLEDLSEAILFEKIGEICAAVNSVSNSKTLLEISLRKTMELFQAKRGSIFMVHENGKNLVLKIAEGMKAAEKKNMVKRMGEGIVGQVAKLKTPIIVEDISKDHRFNKFKPRGSYQTNSFICAPLLLKDKLIGVINITDKETGHRFTKNELRLLDFLSSQIALNYRRVELYKQFKTVVKESRTLKTRLGKTDKETAHLKRQIVIQEKLATIGKLAGGIAHEFNNPLDGVMRYTNLSIEHVEENEVVRGYLIEIKHGLNRMANIVRNLLACCRNDMPVRERIDFTTVVDHSISTVETLLFHRNIKIERKIQNNIPYIKDLGLERILVNLLRNAIDAMKQGGKIVIKGWHEDNQLVMEVKDTGEGIAESHIEKIFEPFYTTKDIDKGCGLGLTIVSEIVKSYDGKIAVNSKVGQGTTFTITLPID
jgi:signal transduction histidine kinase